MQALSFLPHSYEAIVQPQRIFPINAYFLDHWLPYLTPAQAWLIIALRQRAYHNKRQNWCEVAHLHLAAETGLSLSTIKNFFKAPLTAWFVPRCQSRVAYRSHLAYPGRSANRYTLAALEPLTPLHLAGLWEQLQQVKRTQVESFLDELASQPPLDLQQQLAQVAGSWPLPHQADGAITSLVAQRLGRLLPPTTRHACLALHRHLLAGSPLLSTQYFRQRWLPLLGPTLAWLVVVLRRRCYHNSATGEARPICTWAKADLARSLGLTQRHLFGRLLSHPHAAAFFSVEQETTETMTFRVQMWQDQEPLTPDDAARLPPLPHQLSFYSAATPDIFTGSFGAFLTTPPTYPDIFDEQAEAPDGHFWPAFKHSLNTEKHETLDSFDSFSEKKTEEDAAAADKILWEQALRTLQGQMTRVTFETLLLGATCLGREGDTLLIGVRTPSAQVWLTHRLMHVVADTVKRVWQQPLTVEFRAKPSHIRGED